MAEETNIQYHRSVFFKAGGTLSPDNPSYVERPADDELFDAIIGGKFCYVLTTRQMGKSSLMVRTARRLEEAGVATAIIDLTHIGSHATAEQWFLGLLTYLVAQLQLVIDLEEWWRANNVFSPVQRFTTFMREVVLNNVLTPVAIFIDEIDYTLTLDFSDDFFAAIRAFHNARATESIYERLTFILLGVATPIDLIKDPRRTPFNIGQQIDLREFRREESKSRGSLRNLRQGLEAVYPGEGDFIFERVFYWTGGHPYLTQKLCLLIVDEKVYKRNSWSKEDIDKVVERGFLQDQAKADTNIQFVSDKVLKHPQRNQLLTLYRKTYESEKEPDDKRSYLHNQLKLTGLVKANNGYLVTNNRIYSNIFDLDWIGQHTGFNWSQHAVPIATVVVVVLVIAFIGIIGLSNGSPTNDLALTQTALSIGTNDTSTPTSTLEATIETVTPALTGPPVSTLISTSSSGATNIPTLTPTLAPTDTPPSTPTDTPLPGNFARASQSAGIFPAPSTNFEQVAIANSDELVEVLGRATSSGWLYVRYNAGIDGFAATNLFDFVGDFSALPIIPTPKIAIALDFASILPQPGASTESQLAFISPGEQIEVSGRSANSRWLYVRNDQSVEGFAFLDLLDWPGTAEELEMLPIRD